MAPCGRPKGRAINQEDMTELRKAIDALTLALQASMKVHMEKPEGNHKNQFENLASDDGEDSKEDDESEEENPFHDAATDKQVAKDKWEDAATINQKAKDKSENWFVQDFKDGGVKVEVDDYVDEEDEIFLRRNSKIEDEEESEPIYDDYIDEEDEVCLRRKSILICEGTEFEGKVSDFVIDEVTEYESQAFDFGGTEYESKSFDLVIDEERIEEVVVSCSESFVLCGGKVCNVVLDGGSLEKDSNADCREVKLPSVHPHPFKIGWLQKGHEPNTYSFIKDNKNYVLYPLQDEVNELATEDLFNSNKDRFIDYMSFEKIEVISAEVFEVASSELKDAQGDKEENFQKTGKKYFYKEELKYSLHQLEKKAQTQTGGFFRKNIKEKLKPVDPYIYRKYFTDSSGAEFFFFSWGE